MYFKPLIVSYEVSDLDKILGLASCQQYASLWFQEVGDGENSVPVQVSMTEEIQQPKIYKRGRVC